MPNFGELYFVADGAGRGFSKAAIFSASGLTFLRRTLRAPEHDNFSDNEFPAMQHPVHRL
jgi:hypothetical protein